MAGEFRATVFVLAEAYRPALKSKGVTVRLKDAGSGEGGRHALYIVLGSDEGEGAGDSERTAWPAGVLAWAGVTVGAGVGVAIGGTATGAGEGAGVGAGVAGFGAGAGAGAGWPNGSAPWSFRLFKIK